MTHVSQKKLEKIVLDIYRELYENSEPKADFDHLMKTSPLNEFNQIDIPFMDYEIDQDIMDNIIEKHIKRNKISGYNAKQIKTTVYLGCSPKSKLKNDN